MINNKIFISIILITKFATAASSAHAQNGVRIETISYHDNISKWSLGKIKSNAINGITVNETSYDQIFSMPIQISSFGRISKTLTYNSDGTVRTIKDANNNTTTLSNWRRGIPQSVTYADGTSEYSDVNENGWISRTIDVNGYETNYSHDGMGRLIGLTYPAGDTIAWAPMRQTFSQIQTNEHGIPAGHWRLTSSLGAYVKTTYFDGLWRPLLTSEHDANDVVNTQRFTGYEYDHEGRTVFSSYPSSNSNPDRGLWAVYDALGRIKSASQDSEHGLLTTTTTYSSDALGAYTVVRNPRGGEVRSWYQMFGEPSYEMPIRITHPEGAITTISRDPFGKPTSIARTSLDGSSYIARHYQYNSYQQLCASAEPETGLTLWGYDAVGNVTWTASGLTDALPCQSHGNASAIAARMVTRTYDIRNRLTSISFPDGNGSQTWQYTLDGKPSRIVTQDTASATQAINTYTYNKRRLITSEASGQDLAYNWIVNYSYDANGALAGLTYPSGLHIDYSPNALGQPTRVGSYALGVSYYPNGSIRQFTYGNGIMHTVKQNARQLPEHVTDNNTIDNIYSYDENGNVTGITDLLDATRTRSMTYDALDRLVQVTSPSFGGNGHATYSYDALDNLLQTNYAGIRTHNYLYDTSNLLRNIVNDAGATIMGFAYDTQGNIANKNGQTYNFDYGNRLRHVTGKETYRYDGHGRRVVSWNASQGNIISMYGLDGLLRRQDDHRKAKISEYVYLNGSLIAKVSTSTAPVAPALTIPSYSDNGSYNVTWSTVPSATSYTVQEQYNSGTWQDAYNGAGQYLAKTGRISGVYGYRARACREAHCGDWSSTSNILVNRPPSGQPHISAPALSNDGSYILTWGSIPGADAYKLDESRNGSSWVQLSSSDALSMEITNKDNGTYSYRLSACNAAGCGGISTTVSVRVVYPPSRPPMLTGPGTSTTSSYSINWTTVPESTNYSLEEINAGGSWRSVYSGTSNSHTFSNKETGSYTYRARACNDGGCSGYSQNITLTVLTPPAGTLNLFAQQINGNNDYSITWNPITSATNYRLEEKYNDSNWKLIHDGSNTSRTLSGKVNGSYTYRAQACNTSGCTNWSPVLGIVVAMPPQTPAGTRATLEKVSNKEWAITAYWDSVSGATTYQLRGLWEWSGSATSYGEIWEAYTPPWENSSFQVRACNTYGCSPWSTTFIATE